MVKPVRQIILTDGQFAQGLSVDETPYPCKLVRCLLNSTITMFFFVIALARKHGS